VELDLEDLFGAECAGSVHAVRLDGTRETGWQPDRPMVPASVVKVLVAVEAESRMADGRLEPTERVTVGEAERTVGPVGLSLLADPVEVSLRDLSVLMLTLSDNAATDALLGRVGLGAVNATGRRLGLRDTVLTCDIGGLLASIAVDAGFQDWSAYAAWRRSGVDVATALTRLSRARALSEDPPTRTTARDMTTLLRAVWGDEAGPPAACARVRDLMAQQLTRQRIARGFGPGTTVAAKSGGLLGVARNEVGVVTFPEGDAYAVAVLTRSDDPLRDERVVDDAIAEAAARAVARLRRP
jgi:beta-lactamase class A